MSPMLTMRSVVKEYDGRRVLDGLDLELGPKDRLMVTGPNGSGKTTLLRIVASTLRPDEGTVDPVSNDGAAWRRHLGYVPHQAPLEGDLPTRSMTKAWIAVRGAALDAAALDALLVDAGIPRSAWPTPVRNLSRGQRQRLALALAFFGTPALLVLDEPWTGLDEGGAAWLDAKLQAHEGALLVASHDPDRAARLSCTVATLESGHWKERAP